MLIYARARAEHIAASHSYERETARMVLGCIAGFIVVASLIIVAT